MTNRYRFITRWRIRASAEDVFEILRQPLEYPRWWPAVYLDAREIAPGRVRLLTRGWLPYTLTWEAAARTTVPPNLLEVQASGDFEGRGIWSLVPDGEFTDITFDWKVTACKPLLRNASFLLRPVFEANHRWAMEQGRRSLELELDRVHAVSVEDMNGIPDAPAPNRLITRESLACGAIVAVAVAAMIKSVKHP